MPFPVHRDKYRHEGLFTGGDFVRYHRKRWQLPTGKVPDRVVLLFSRRLRAHVLRGYQASTVASVSDYGLVRVRPKVGIAFLRMGSPFAAMAMEELIAHGVREFVAVGAAGALDPDLRTGEMVVCTRAIRDEGTSHHYLPASLYAHPTPRLRRQLQSTLDRDDVPYREGPTWTTDAPYRETLVEVRRFRKCGVLTVEMEAAALFTVARRLGAEAAALFVVSDHLKDTGWEPRFADIGPRLRIALREAVRSLAV
jgi:uridine phosphorylase